MTVQERIEDAIKDAIGDYAAQEKERLVAEAVKEFEKSVRSRVGVVAISLADVYSVERLGSDVLIHVKIAGGTK